ncbi:hypothetical protein BDR03DRAFT_962452 [Suillus americanus]|nr:hypothetical protein BDR03DRAFT_962452 [Suillus americanus]
MICCPSGRCMIPQTAPICQIVLLPLMSLSFYYWVKTCLLPSAAPSWLSSKIITYEDNSDSGIAGYNAHFCQVRIDFTALSYMPYSRIRLIAYPQHSRRRN